MTKAHGGRRSEPDVHERADAASSRSRCPSIRTAPSPASRVCSAACRSLLAAIGLYGVTAYAVAQRTNEIGIRMALGADHGAVFSLVLRSAFTRVAIGLMLGVPLAIGAGRLLAAQLYGVAFWDPVALAVAAGSLTLCALVAALIPASRAAAIPPMRALRTE